MSANAKVLLRQCKAGTIGKEVVDACFAKGKISREDYDMIMQEMGWNN